MGIAAGDFLCPNLRTISYALGMSETLAGVTLFAFGNGSSDLFSTFAAMSSHNGTLAVGELFGAAAFITAVVIGAMAVASTFSVPKTSFTRDIGFFAIAAAITMAFIADGELQLWECVIMVGYYLFYVVVVASWHWYTARRNQGIFAGTVQCHLSETDELEVEASEEEAGHEADRVNDGGTVGETSGLLQFHRATYQERHRETPSEHIPYNPHFTPVEVLHPHIPTLQSVTSRTVDPHTAWGEEQESGPGTSALVSCAQTHIASPHTIASALFPTLYPWRGKSLWSKLTGCLTAPMMFLLTLTIPTWNSNPELVDGDQPAESLIEHQASESGQEPIVGSFPVPAPQSRGDTNIIPFGTPGIQPGSPNRAGLSEVPQGERSRWLICIQLLVAPLCLALFIWINTYSTLNLQDFLRLLLSSVFFSLICVGFLLLSTISSSERPAYRCSFCFLGFAVSIAWISSAAAEIVGVMEAFGVILDVSDALLGLTVFAVGNSSNDLIANITIARRGHPVMALSACFGGPMLNILLGIGIGGLFTILKDARDRNTKLPLAYESYVLDVSVTLFISGMTLLTVLVGLLLAVSMNGWRMDRRIGWASIAFWSVSTIFNMVLNLTGVA